MNLSEIFDFGTIIGLLGLISSFIFYRLGKRTRKLLYTKSSKALITDKLSDIEGLHITYGDKHIKNLTSTTLVLKSVGSEAIKAEAFGKATPLCIKTTEDFLLPEDKYSIVTANSNPNNLFELEPKGNQEILLKFDYLREGDSIILTMLHTGEVSVEGEIISGKILDNNSYEKFNRISNFVTWFAIAIAAVLLVILYVLIGGPEAAIVDGMRFLGCLLLGAILVNYYKSGK